MKNIKTSRDNEARINDSLENYSMEFQSGFYVPEHVKRDGYSYKWVRKEVRGQHDNRLEQMASQGWVPVPADRGGSELNLDPLDRNPLSKKFYTNNDLIFMERPSVYCKREKRELHELNNSRLKLKGVTNDTVGRGNQHNSINSF